MRFPAAQPPFEGFAKTNPWNLADMVETENGRFRFTELQNALVRVSPGVTTAES